MRPPPLLAFAFAFAFAALLLAPALASAGVVDDGVGASKAVKVCIWPDYCGITYRNPRTQQLGGIDIELAAQRALDLGAAVTWVDSSFPKLIEDFSTDKCDVAIVAIGVLPARQPVLKFIQPYLQSDIYGVTTRSHRHIKTWADVDQPGVQVAVQAGTFIGPVMAATLKQARMVVVKPPMTREAELEAGRVDVFMTDYAYSRRLLDNADWARLVAPTAPFHVLPYAYAVKPGDQAWLKRVDDFVLRIKKDGRLEAAAKRNGLSDIVLAK